MSNYLKSIFLILILSACSTSQPENKWQHEAATMCKNYQLHFLQDKTVRASLDLSHARELATRSANFKPLIDIELTACAMEVSALNPSQCERASKLLVLESNQEQQAYLHLLSSQLQEDEIKYLPQQYRDFAQFLLTDDHHAINQEVSTMQPLSSKLVASALSKDILNDDTIETLIQDLSFKGYKKPLVSWLRLQMQKEEDEEEKSRLKAKIDVLTFD